VGKIFEDFGQVDINIDHHITNEKYGKLNLIESEEVATAAILEPKSSNKLRDLRNAALRVGDNFLRREPWQT
jgi:nanoRNase/pAp phosphatase (c-di-AMP/oligoRNAs hydrolase)